MITTSDSSPPTPHAEPDRLRRLADDWAHGWAVSRGTPPPVAEPDGHRIEVGAPGHRVRYVLPDTTTVGHRATTLTAPGTWLKVCAAPEVVLPALTPAWTVGDTEYLMSTDLSPEPAATPPRPYVVEIVSDGGVHDVVVRTTDGARAANGRIAVHGTAAVADQVETAPEHRRRGLGRVVMSTACAVAYAAGARRAVLVATEQGRALYGALGWSLESPVTPAHLPEISENGSGPVLAHERENS
ncbi:GNAT family N-acetyltransferase [Streptoalloteichus hindustanus]|uniref:Acetyltransferase (GNAT) family protein n=1 Tax=Streptoalloteichus hindustanus TaxID=2017 RepID=A0A1M4Z903_STRHI|nr:GNAT family N-acetyltransferase [Streptoalloteichus hindustanus]SHF14511.1 Acetyltransferase (GNAT) family protein [Streptoalloteichus hindustanus]